MGDLVLLSTFQQSGYLNFLKVVCTDCIGSCKSNYHTITTTMAPTIQYVYMSVHYNCLALSYISLARSLNYCCYNKTESDNKLQLFNAIPSVSFHNIIVFQSIFHFLLKCLYQVRKVSSYWYRFSSFYDFSIGFLEIFRQCGIFGFSFYV